QAIPLLERLGDHSGLARAHRLLISIHGAGCRYAEAEAAAQRTVEHARLAGNEVMAARVLTFLAGCAVYGPTPVPDAIRACEEVLSRAGGDRKAQALTMTFLAHLHALLGDLEQARALYRRGRASLEELGWKALVAVTSLDYGFLEMAGGDLKAAERELRRDYDTLDALGEKNYISTTAGVLA